MKAVQITIEIYCDTQRKYVWFPSDSAHQHIMILHWTYPCDISFHLPLSCREKPICRHCICAFYGFYNRYIGEEHDHHRNEKAKDEDGDDVRLVDGGIIGFGPVHFTSAITPICEKMMGTVRVCYDTVDQLLLCFCFGVVFNWVAYITPGFKWFSPFNILVVSYKSFISSFLFWECLIIKSIFIFPH